MTRSTGTFDRTRRLVLAGAAAGAAALALGAATARAAAVTKISPAELKARLAAKDFYLVNVHIPYEGEIEQTDAFIAFDKIAENLAKLPQDKGAAIVVYCRSGRMSGIASKQLAAIGYTNILDLDGGMNAWKAAGFTIVEK